MTSSSGTDRIVVGVDGSPASVEALRWALRQAELTGADIEAVTAWEIRPALGWEMALPDEGTQELARRIQEDCLGLVLDTEPFPSVDVHRRVVQGPPARALVQVAEGAQLLVVGTRGHSPLVEAVLGSTGQQCVHQATCPVVTVRQVREENAGGG